MTLRIVLELVAALTVLAAAAILWAVCVVVVGGVLRYLDPPSFLLPNGLTVQMPFDDLRTVDIVAASGRAIRHPSEWICFDDLTVWLSGEDGAIALDAVEGRITAQRRGRAADDTSCDRGYFPGNIGLSLFLDDEWFPCDALNPDLDRFAQAQRFRDLCAGRAGTPAPPAR